VPVSVVEAHQRLFELLVSAPPQVVNLHGPLGVGKTRLLAAIRTEVTAQTGIAPTIIDGADCERRAGTAVRLAAAARLRSAAGTSGIVIAGRTRLTDRVDRPAGADASIELAPWPAEDVAILCAGYGLAPAVVSFATRIAGGIPLIADTVCRAIRSGSDPAATGALADAAASEIIRRLATETADLRSIRQIASLDGADEDLLSLLVRRAGTAFNRLRRLSIVAGDHHGLGVREPYRSVLDLAYRWRNPLVRADRRPKPPTCDSGS
jgi:hypothetical protein